jgi:DNA processing protein
MTDRPHPREVPVADPAYPERLRSLARPPAVLHLWGEAELDAPMVALVGTRGARRQSMELARSMAADLARAGWVVVSGGAIGVDTAAHEGALEGGGTTVAILGSGLGKLYPERNRALFARIARQGAVVSHFPHDTPPRPENFPQRNLLVAALARAVVVVEAPVRSGALNTARHARELGIPLLAVPCGAGAVQLLRRGAGLVGAAQDVLDVLAGRPPRPFLEPPADPDLRQVLELVRGQEQVGVDEVAGGLGWSVARAAGALLKLELAGWVRPLPGGRYSVEG